MLQDAAYEEDVFSHMADQLQGIVEKLSDANFTEHINEIRELVTSLRADAEKSKTQDKWVQFNVTGTFTTNYEALSQMYFGDVAPYPQEPQEEETIRISHSRWGRPDEESSVVAEASRMLDEVVGTHPGGLYSAGGYDVQVSKQIQWFPKGRTPIDERSELRDASEAEIEMGVRYHHGDLTTSPITRPFRASQKEDVVDINDLSDTEALELERLGALAVAKGKGDIRLLAAGASSRMNVKDAPQEVLEMDVDGEIESKAGVPIGRTLNGEVSTYLGEFGTNISRLFSDVNAEAEAAGLEANAFNNTVGFLSNDEYRAEHDGLLSSKNYYGLNPEKVRFFHQPLGAKFIGTVADVESLKEKFSSQEAYEEALQKIQRC